MNVLGTASQDEYDAVLREIKSRIVKYGGKITEISGYGFEVENKGRKGGILASGMENVIRRYLQYGTKQREELLHMVLKSMLGDDDASGAVEVSK